MMRKPSYLLLLLALLSPLAALADAPAAPRAELGKLIEQSPVLHHEVATQRVDELLIQSASLHAQCEDAVDAPVRPRLAEAARSLEASRAKLAERVRSLEALARGEGAAWAVAELRTSASSERPWLVAAALVGAALLAVGGCAGVDISRSMWAAASMKNKRKSFV